MNSRTIDSAAISAKGSFSLLVGNIFGFIINAVGAIIVARLLTPSEYGIFTLTLVLPAFFNLFTSFGTHLALTRSIVRYRINNNTDKIIGLVRAGYLFNVITGGFFSLILYLFADVLSITILNRPNIGSYLRIASFLILSQSIFVTGRSIFSGYENMNNSAIVSVFQSSIKGVVSPLLVYLGYGVNGVIIGHVLSFTFAALLGIILSFRITDRAETGDSGSVIQSLRLMLRFGFPLYLGNIIAGVAIQFQGFLLSWFVAADMIGNYGVASWFRALIGVVTMSITLTFLPAFSKFDANLVPEKAKEVFQGSIKFSTIFLMPLISLLIVTSEPAIYTLFGSKYPQAPMFLTLMLVPSLFIGLGSLSIMTFLNSQEETRATMMINSIGAILSIILSFTFIWLWNIEGLLISFVISSMFQNLVGLQVMKTKYGIWPNFKHTGKTILCSFISGVISLSFQWLLPQPVPLLTLILRVAIFVPVFLIIAPLIGAIERNDLINLDSMLSNIKLLYPLTHLIMKIEHKILDIRQKKKI